ncbi:DUF4837 family protein [Bacteroides sp. 224]|uniref:DUF4837 family protein n=1 Tax=Bacteroides sp. 224 TaxID=2302936 RepID=UPI0013D30EF9|nr:DUF4837 family protein [Bacteroides sp. 224]NDV65082.1 DUF4837 family protein [Bacteroides sp. 224]
MRKGLFYLTMIAIAVMFSSCKGKKSVFSPTSTGAPYEILVVTDLGVWERPAGRALYNVLDSDVAGLPQPEPAFKIMFTSPHNFDAILKVIRSIVVVDINKDKYTQAKFQQSSDVYASPQAVLTIQAPSEQEFAAYVTENKQAILDYFNRFEMNYQMRNLEVSHSDMISQKVKELFNADVWAPAELMSSKTGENFFWASTNTATSDMSIVVYSYPYTDKETFTRDYFIHKRDSVMKENIPGSKEGMYVQTDSMTVETREIAVQGEYAFEARGLWRMKNDFMGGPFVSQTRLDKANNRIVTAEVFIFSPDKPKKKLIRKMEASLYTLRFLGQQQRATTGNKEVAIEE